jgi:hypothetical protein
MNINIVSTADDFLNGNIQFIPEIFENQKENPYITIRENSEGKLGIHLTGWDCKESVEVYDEYAILELQESLIQAATFLKNLKQDASSGQLNLFENIEEIDIVREN